MATMLLSHSSPCLAMTASSKTGLSMAWGTRAMTTPDSHSLTSSQIPASTVNISHWSPTQQAGLLTNLALISQGNQGWILVANAPAPLSRQLLINAGINPARVIDARQASSQLIEQAMTCPSIAAVVCWKGSHMVCSTLRLCKKSRRH